MERLYAGIDETGLANIAGPFVASVVVLPENHGIKRLPFDSKRLGRNTIHEVAKEIREKAIYYKISWATPRFIRLHGHKAAIEKIWEACARSVRIYDPTVPILIDGEKPIPGVSNQYNIKFADAKYDNVSAAAILARDWHIRFMKKIHKIYPMYQFDQNYGYPSKEHKKAIEKYGPVCFHHYDPNHPRKKGNRRKRERVTSKILNGMPSIEEILNQLY